MKSIKRRHMILSFFILTFFIFGILTRIYIDTDKELADVSDKLIRLHVVANSDSPEDQELKRRVRDEVISRMSPQFEGLKNIEEVKEVIHANLGLIESIAAEVIEKEELPYGVEASLADYDFPTKVYGNLTLPAGNYQALKVVIGSGRGQNWWCVMFPPLCFIDIAHGVVPEKTMKELKNSLTDEEYRLLVSSKTQKDTSIKLRFKIVEMTKSMNSKLVKLGLKK